MCIRDKFLGKVGFDSGQAKFISPDFLWLGKVGLKFWVRSVSPEKIQNETPRFSLPEFWACRIVRINTRMRIFAYADIR